MSTPELLIKPSANRVSAAERAEKLAKPAFGRTFTDHMVVVPYRDGAWQQGEVTAYGPLSLDPSASSLHYGQAIFEGFKAYHQADGSIKAFRPEANAERFNRSARRLADRLAVLDQGRIVAVGTIAELAKSDDALVRSLVFAEC